MTWNLYPDEKGGERVVQAHRGNGYVVAGVTGTMAAALAQDSLVFAMRADPALGAGAVLDVRRIRLQYTTIVAYTVPITAGRRLGIYRGASGTPNGQTALTAVARDTSIAGASSGLAGAQISTTAALTANGFVREANAQGNLPLVHVGAAGAFIEELYEFYGETAPLYLNAGEGLAISNPVAMDAAGTWQLAVIVDYMVCAGKLVK